VKDIQFKQLEPADLPQLAGWFCSPHVARWWSSPVGETAFAAKYIARMRADSLVSVFVISLDGEPVGIIQADRRVESKPPGACGIDLLIGKRGLIGRGLGPAIIEAFVSKYIFGSLAASCCIADPVLANRRSVRAFEKAGFIPIRTFSEKGEMHILLERHPSN
jgi:aminoglycoside 6'-N-acetyltransferase